MGNIKQHTTSVDMYSQIFPPRPNLPPHKWAIIACVPGRVMGKSKSASIHKYYYGTLLFCTEAPIEAGNLPCFSSKINSL